jgi:GAF domain-containing protein
VRDEVIGLLELMQAGQDRGFTSTEVSLCQTLANQAAAVLENARLFQETEARVREMESLVTVGQVMTTLELDDVLDIIAENALAAARSEISSVYLWDEDQGLLVPKSVRGMRSDELHRAVFKLGEGTIGQVAQTGEPLLVQDVSRDAVFDVKTDAAKLIHNTLTVPLAVKNQIIGTLEVCNKIGADSFSTTDEQLLTAFAAQAAVAIENARLFQAEREQRELAEALRQAAAVVGSTLDLDQVLDRILEHVSRVIPSRVANVMVIEGDLVRTVRWRGYGEFGTEGMVSSVVLSLKEATPLRQMKDTGKSLVIPDTERYPDWLNLPGQDWLRSYAGAPIRVRDEVIGFLNVDSPTPGFFNQTHAERLQAFADQASLAIANARLYQEVRHHLEEVLILNEFSRAAISTLELDDVLRRGLSALVGARNFERVHLLLVDEAKNELWLHEALTELFPHRKPYRIAVGEGIVGQVAQTGSALRVADVRQVSNYIEGYPDTRGELCVPLRAGDRIIGVLDAQSVQLDAFTEADERLLGTLAGLLSTIIENAHLFSESQQRIRELTALTQVSQALNEAMDLNTILDVVLEETFDLLKGHEGSVLLIDPPDGNRLRMVAERGLGMDLMTAFNSRPVYSHEGTYKRALRSGRIVEVADTKEDPDFLQDVGSEAKTVTNIPLVTERGAIGIIAVDGLPQDDTTRRLLAALADMAAVAIEKERLRQETSDRLAEVTTLYTLATQIASSLSPETVMDSIVTILKLTLEPRACSIYLLDPTGEYVQLVAGTGLSPSWKGVARLKVGEGVSGRVIAERRSVYVPDTHLEPDFIFFDPSVRSLLVVPLIVRDRAIGTLSIDNTKPNAFDNEVRLLTIAATQAAVAIENARLYESLQSSYTDLERAYDELRHLDQMKSEFVQNISHELRTPLTFIKGYVELMQDGDMGDLNEDQRRAMDIVMTKADVLSRLVDDIISLQQAGRARSEFETLSLVDLGHAG